MQSADNRKVKPTKIEYDKIIVNIPKKLLEEFDMVSSANNYSRAEAIKEAIRQFIIEQTPEDYIPQQMRKLYMESAEDAGAGLVKGMAKAAAFDPEIQKMQQQNVSAGIIAGINKATTDLQIQNIQQLKDAYQPKSLSQTKLFRQRKKKHPPNKEDFERAKKEYPNKWKKDLK